MKQKLALAIIVGGLAIAACDDDAPTTPTPTRIIVLSGNMNFGNVVVGTFAERTLTIRNTGNSPLSVTGILVPNGYSTNFVAATIQPEALQEVIVRLTPTQPIAYAGVLTVTGDQTSGNATLSITGMGTLGSTVFR